MWIDSGGLIDALDIADTYCFDLAIAVPALAWEGRLVKGMGPQAAG